MFARLSELVDAVTLDLLILDEQKPGLHPLAYFVESDFADNSGKRMFVNIASGLLLINRANPCNRLSENCSEA